MTDRTLTAGVTTETENDDYRLAAFVELDFATDPVYVWTGVGTITATMPGGSSHDWLGTGDLGSISGLVESSDRAQNGVRLTMTDIDNDLLPNALTQDYQGRDARIWAVYFDDDGAIIPDPVQVFGGEMDTIECMEGDEKGVISVFCESSDGKLARRTESLLTDEEQQRLFPGDKGLEFVAELQSKQILWGQPGASRDGARPGTGPFDPGFRINF